jgi:hypothetical protein
MLGFDNRDKLNTILVLTERAGFTNHKDLAVGDVGAR